MQVNIVNLENKAAGTVELSDAVYGIKEIRADIISRVVQWQLDKRRAGTHKTKGISEIRGTTKKPYRQKGSGNARQGSLRSPQYRGGAVIFGPVVRSHEYSLNKKIRALGLRMALSDKAANGDLIVVDSLPETAVKTKDMVATLQKLGLDNALFIAQAENTHFRKGINNIPHVDVLPVIGANVYSVIRAKKLVLTKEAAKQLEERLS